MAARVAPCRAEPAWPPQAQPLPEHVSSHPGATLLVGPLFAAFTGVAFKEGEQPQPAGPHHASGRPAHLLRRCLQRTAAESAARTPHWP